MNELALAYLSLATDAQARVVDLERALAAARTTRDAATYDAIRHGAAPADMARRLKLSRAGVLKIERRESEHRLRDEEGRP